MNERDLYWPYRILLLVGLVLIELSRVCAGTSRFDSDLSTIDFSNDELVVLNDGWKIHWNQLLTPAQVKSAKTGINLPHGLCSWTSLNIGGATLPSFGVATYTKRLILPANVQSLSIGLPKINSSAKLWINDDLAFEAGVVSDEATKTLHRRTEAFVPIKQLVDTVTLTLQVANFYHREGGILRPITIGATTAYWQAYQNKLISDMVLIGSLFFMGISLLVLYYAYWRSDKAILYLAIFSLCWGYRNLSDEYAPLTYIVTDLPWIWLVKIEYLSLFFGSLIGLQYLRVIFKRSFPDIFAKIITWVCLPFMLLALLLPSALLSYSLYLFFGSMVILLSYVIFVLITSERQRLQSFLGLAGIFSGILVITYHMFSFNVWGEANNTMISIGYLITLMINALLLGKRFSVSYSYKDKMQKDVELQNVEISEQANILSKTKGLLEAQVALRTKELEKVVLDLKERNNHLEQFNYIVSHNMRAPVSNIMGLTNIYNLEDSEDPFNTITIEKIQESVHALDDVLKDLTSVLEVKQKLNHPNEKVVFHDLIVKIKKSIFQQITQSQIQIEIDCEVESIVSNGAYWYSIFINLISNAIKYSRHDVQSFIKIRTIRENDKQVRVEVRDNGLGIDLKANKQEVFGLYKRFHNHIEGKGMGLFMVRTQVESMGGHIEVSSEPNVGTTFEITV